MALMPSLNAQWIDIENLRISQVQTELGGTAIDISYDLNTQQISEDFPVYIFVRYARQGENVWQLLDRSFLQGDGYGIVNSRGAKKITWWGSGLREQELPEVKVWALPMAKVPAGEFIMRSFPGGGKDPSRPERPDALLADYYVAINETTNEMYADFLNESGQEGGRWHNRMANPRRGGIEKIDSAGWSFYKPIQGREHYPIIYVSWYDAHAFLNWCGLSLPTELMWEKAYVGGIYLDGDKTRQLENPAPQRVYPWGNEAPDEGGIYRCNIDGDADGYVNQAPVGTFDKYQSPYSINDLAGNVAEWTLDWYSTSYHAGLDGFRMARGGSWMATSIECDVVSGATQFPIKESSIMGFRGALKK